MEVERKARDEHLNGAEIEEKFQVKLPPIQFSIIYISAISINVQVLATI